MPSQWHMDESQNSFKNKVVTHHCPLNCSKNKLLDHMAPKPLKVLKKGLAKFMKTIKVLKKELNAKLARAETISSLDGKQRSKLSLHLMIWSLWGHFR
jgi:hypothetical protein